MRMRLMLLGGGSALGQALIRLGAEEDIGFLAPRPPENGWDAASLTDLLDDTRPDALINLAYYFDWFQAESVAESRLATQERAVERLAELCQHHGAMLIINDDLELAARLGVGLHLGQGDGSLAAARARLGGDCVIGGTCHAQLELAERAVAEGASDKYCCIHIRHFEQHLGINNSVP